MLLTITSTHPPATDLGYLLHKNPGRCQSFELPFGMAHVFYPEASDSRCTVAVLLEIDPVGLVRRQGKTLREYVNDRPYAASSFLSVAISRVFGTAMRGKSKERPGLAQTPLPLSARISVLPCREGQGFLKRLFEPLGYAVRAEPQPVADLVARHDVGRRDHRLVQLQVEPRLRDLVGRAVRPRGREALAAPWRGHRGRARWRCAGQAVAGRTCRRLAGGWSPSAW